MMDNIRMDSHKLLYHPQRVADWMDGKTIYPIEIEIGLSGACNHRCIFCAVDYMGYQPNFLDTKIVLDTLKVLADKGLKSVIYSGEGEPLLHKDASLIIAKTKEFGIDAALATNGVLFTKDKAEKCLHALTWIRFSIAAATEETYQKIQRGKPGDFGRVLKNLEDSVAIKREKKLRTTLGAQLLLLPENRDEVVMLAKTLREIGLDYLTVKPFSQHPSSIAKRTVDYSETDALAEELKNIATDTFQIHFRRQSMENVAHEKSYDRCHALPFMTHIDAKGKVFPCIAFVGDENLSYGNLYEKSFVGIWENSHTVKIMNTFCGDYLRNKCRKACRLDEMNKYLHELKHPGEHANFI